METDNLSRRISAIRNYFLTNVTKDVVFRIDALKKLKTQIINHEADIIKALYDDLHKSDFEAYSTEISLVIQEIDLLCRRLHFWARPKHKLTPLMFWPSMSKIIHEPYGVVLIIAPWNYPFQLLISPLVAAIGAGNCAVLKTSPYSPAINNVMESIIKKTFSPDYVSIFHGNRDVNTALLAERYDYIFFTGSPSLGKTVMAAASKNLTPITLELGGKSPCIVDEDANVEIASRRIIWGKTLNSGQTCIAPDYLMVHENIKEEFISTMEKHIKEMYGEDPRESPDYPRIISDKAMTRLVGYLKTGSLVMGGRYDIKERYIEPTVITNLPPDAPILNEEIFGPIFPLIFFTNIDEVIKHVKSREKPLALYYFTGDKKKILKMLKETSSGGACINDTIIHVGNHRIPFGGVGNSGMGMYHGRYGFETFSHSKAVVVSSTNIDIKIKYPPYGNKLNRFKRFL